MKNIAMLLGMPRAATTFMYHHFDAHPDIFVPYRRKTNYFSLHFAKRDDDWFWSHFKDASGNQVCVDTETLSFIDKTIIPDEKIINSLGKKAKYILCVRHPGEWAFSLYKQLSTFEKNMPNFDSFLQYGYAFEEDGISLSFNYRNGDIKRRIEELRSIHQENIKIIDYGDIECDPNKVLQEIEEFLGVRSFYLENPVDKNRINSSNKKHSKIISKVLRNRFLIGVLSLMPSKFVKSIRIFYDSYITKDKSTEHSKPVEKEVTIASKYFSEDVEYYNSLFK